MTDRTTKRDAYTNEIIRAGDYYREVNGCYRLVPRKEAEIELAGGRTQRMADAEIVGAKQPPLQREI